MLGTVLPPHIRVKLFAIFAPKFDSEHIFIFQSILFLPFSSGVVAPKTKMFISCSRYWPNIKSCLCHVIVYRFNPWPDVSFLQLCYHIGYCLAVIQPTRRSTFPFRTILSQDFIATYFIFPITYAFDESLWKHDYPVKFEVLLFSQYNEMTLYLGDNTVIVITIRMSSFNT